MIASVGQACEQALHPSLQKPSVATITGDQRRLAPVFKPGRLENSGWARFHTFRAANATGEKIMFFARHWGANQFFAGFRFASGEIQRRCGNHHCGCGRENLAAFE